MEGEWFTNDVEQRCKQTDEGKPFACQLIKGHPGCHEDWSVSVNGGPWTFE